MNPSEIEQVLSQIRKAPGGARGKAKALAGLIKEMPAANKEVFAEILRLAHDDFVRFGINVTDTERGEIMTKRIPGGSPEVMVTLGRLKRFHDRMVSTNSRAEKLEIIVESAENCGLSALLLFDIVKKDLGLELQAKSMRSALPGVFTEFSVMLAHPFEERRMKGVKMPVGIEPKLDGIRVVAEVNTVTREVGFYTRSGRTVTSLDKFKADAAFVADEILRRVHIMKEEGVAGVEGFSGPVIWIDGEVVSGSFLETISDVRKKDVQVEEGTFMVFDFMPPTFMEKPFTVNYADRRKLLNSVRALPAVASLSYAQVIRSYFASSEEEIMTFYGNWQAQGLEGAIVKRMDGIYESKRSSAWLKLKGELTLDLPIVGYFEGVGKYEGMLGGFIVDYKGNHVRVGSGFADAQREAWWPIVQADERSDGERKILGKLAEVQYQEETDHGSLRHPVFIRIRHDREEAPGSF